MNENAKRKNEFEIDFLRLLMAALHKSWLIGLAAVVCAVAAFLWTHYFVTPLYQSSAMFYVNNNAIDVDDASLSISTSDITASKNLVNSYIVILNTRATLNDVIDYAGVDRGYSEVKGMIAASSVDETEIFRVVVTSPDPQEAEQIANAIAYILPNRITDIIEGTSTKVVDSAIVAASPSSPNYTRNAMLGFLVGLALSLAIVVLREIFDITIRSDEDITRNCSHPILASVPDMEAASKGGYYYGSSGGKHQKGKSPDGSRETKVVGAEISFAASEAYKLLRTKLQFSFADENDCHVIGVSSSLAGEGKSTTAVNLAYSLAQLDNRVLLIECDLRRPTLASKIPVSKMPGLTNYLTRQEKLEDIIQTCALDESCTFHVISSGRIPPNPIELLSSARMTKALSQLKASYDYIIMDLPPTAEVSDALVAAKMADGMLLVVRQNYCNRIALDDTIRQFEFVDARVLGVVTTCAVENGGGYGKKYYKRYYAKYEGAYAAAAKTTRKRASDGKGRQ